MAPNIDNRVALLLIACISVQLGRSTGEVESIQLTLSVRSQEFTVPCDDFVYFQVEATEVCRDLRIEATASEGEPDLYVSKEGLPTGRHIGWTSYEWGSESLTISSWDPEYELGTFYIGVYAYCENDTSIDVVPAKVTVLAQHVETTHPHDEIAIGGSVIGTVDALGYSYHRFCLPSRCSRITLTLDSCNDPAECPMSYSDPDIILSRSIQSPTVNDYTWKLAEFEGQTIQLGPGDDEFCAGHYFVSVYGYCVPDNLCNNPASCGPCAYAGNHEYTVSLTTTDVTGCDADTPCKAISTCISSITLLIMALMTTIICRVF